MVQKKSSDVSSNDSIELGSNQIVKKPGVQIPVESYVHVEDVFRTSEKEAPRIIDKHAILESLEGKTIRITTLSADIVNSSEKVKTLSSEEAGKYYQIFIESTSDIIERYGGYVLKNVGDCVIGFFPCSKHYIENHDRAVLCGLAIRDMIKNFLNYYYRSRKLPSIACRVSADFGEVKVLPIKSNGHYSDIDLFGKPMNSVAKISHYAKPNQMVIGDSLFWELIHSDNFVFKLLKRWDPGGKCSYPVYLVERKGVHNMRW